MASADVLILLSDVDGLYTANPMTDPNAQHIAVVKDITPAVEAMAGEAINEASKGGMKTKLMAAKTATAAGCALIIMEGDQPKPVSALVNGAKHTWFAPNGDPQVARKRWIAAMKPKGDLHVDAGAGVALAAGKSLLAAGVTEVTGVFRRGDPVAILGPTGAALGKGLVAFDSAECVIVKGRHSREIEDLLGYAGRAALIHRDDMVL